MSKLKVQYVCPGPLGLRDALGRFVKRGSLVSAVSDAKLRILKEIAEDGDVEVLPIGQLVGRFLNVQGEPYGRLATKGQVKALIARACEDLDPESPFRKVARFPGFHHAVHRVLDQLAHADWDEWDLDRAADTLDETDAARVRSVAAIRTSVEAMMDELNLERLQHWVRCSHALENLRPNPIESVVLFAGPDPNPLVRQWAEWAASTGTRVTWIEEGFGFLGKPQKQWSDALFTETVAPQDHPSVMLQTAADPLAECEWALREAAQARASGIPEHRITIVARSAETYTPLLLASARRLGVSVDAPLPVPLLTNAFAAWTHRLLTALAGTDVRALIGCVFGSYSGLESEGRAEAEQAIVEAYRDGPEAWQTLADWCEREADRQPWLGHALRWRAGVHGSRLSVGGWHARLRELVVGPVTPISVFETRGGEPPTSARDVRAQTAMFRAVGQYALAHDRFVASGLDLSGFADLAGELWKSEDVVLPSDGFGVRIASGAAAVGPSDLVIVLGMLEGSFPRRPTEDAVLPDDIRVALNRVLPDKPLPLAADIPVAERCEFVRLCAAAERSLILSHPQADDETSVPAFFLMEMKRALGDRIHQKVYSRDTLTPDEPTLPADQDLRLDLVGPKAFPPIPVLQTMNGRLAVRAPIENGIRPEELATALECPFRSVFRYRLELFPSTRRDPWRRLRRLPREARLAMATDEAAARSSLDIALDEALDRLLGEFEPWELEFFRATAASWIDGWIRREFAARNVWHKAGGERMGPLGYGDPPLQNKIKGVRLEGRVDALSIVEPYAVIHRFDEVRPPFKGADQVSYGLMLLSAYHASEGKAIALEIDDGDTRRLMVLPRLAVGWAHGNQKESLSVHEIGTHEGTTLTEARSTFAREVVAKLDEAVEVLRVASAQPVPGNYCKSCPYGELCRNSTEFGETPNRFDTFARESDE